MTNEDDSVVQPDGLINTLNTVIPAGWALTPVNGQKHAYTLGWTKTPVSRDSIAIDINSGKAKGFGLITGKLSGGIMAIDCDGHKPHDLFKDILGGDIPHTVAFTSGKDGRAQYLFQVPEEHWDSIKTKKFGDADDGGMLELRWDGCQSVLPPSVHPETGQYIWTNSPETTEIVSLPDKVLTHWKEATSKPTRSTKTTPKKAGRPPKILPQVEQKIGELNGQIPANLKSHIELQLSNIIKATDGNRNDKLRDASLALGRMGQNGLDRETASGLLVWCAEVNGIYNDEPEQCDRTINGGLDNGFDGDPWRVKKEDSGIDYKSMSRQPVSIKELIIDIFGKLYPDCIIRFNSRLNLWEIGSDVFSANSFILKFKEAINYSFPRDSLDDAALMLSLDKTVAYDPIVEYLDSLKIKNCYLNLMSIKDLEDFLGVCRMDARLFKRWLISAVARAYEPGCQAHMVLLLKGQQGIGKSSFFKWLAGKEYYVSGVIGGGKDGTIANNLCWINELEEVDRYNSKHDVSEIKTELSKEIDLVRRPYGREFESIKRGFVFTASTNSDTPLRDESNRRWGCLSITKKLLPLLTPENRDSIWSVGVLGYFNGEQWWLDDEERAYQNEVNKSFTEDNIYAERLTPYLDVILSDSPYRYFKIDSLLSFLDEKPSPKSRSELGKFLISYGLERQAKGSQFKGGFKLPVNHHYFAEYDRQHNQPSHWLEMTAVKLRGVESRIPIEVNLSTST
jgi:Virulence-associated protein E/Bifunctional DNA primase/polymerase, N-terminal